MFKVIFFIAVILLVVFIIALIAVGLCLGIAHLMIYFIPTIALVNALVPAAILTTVLIVVFGEMLKNWGNAWAESQSILSDYYYEDEDDDEEDDEPEPPPVTRSHPNRNNRNRR